MEAELLLQDDMVANDGLECLALFLFLFFSLACSSLDAVTVWPIRNDLPGENPQTEQRKGKRDCHVHSIDPPLPSATPYPH